jgi:hypothetical protein
VADIGNVVLACPSLTKLSLVCDKSLSLHALKPLHRLNRLRELSVLVDEFMADFRLDPLDVAALGGQAALPSWSSL